jgi:hypothetical protein
MLHRFYFTLLFFFAFSNFGNCQHDHHQCASESPDDLWEREFQKLISEFKSNDGGNSNSVSYTIPVIFHIIHGGEPIGTFPNILSGQVDAQFRILNQDFNANAYNINNYPSNAFVNWATSQNIPAANLDQFGRIKIADFEIQFCPATVDPSGNVLPEPGIERIDFNSKGWPAPDLFPTQATMKNYLDSIVKPQSVWDVTKYLNVWITDKSNLLTYGGVSSVPPLSGLIGIPNTATDSTDGIWCYTKVIGAYSLFPSGSYISQYIDGRTMTHEVGHYLGLRHIWGDAACGNDFCADTPPAAAQNTGSPSYPDNPGSCSSPSNNPDGEMFMNFMDYSMGPSKFMFTTDQKTRAQTAMLNSPYRNRLGTHNLCSGMTGITTIENNFTPYVSPNPGSRFVRILPDNQNIISVKIYDLSGVLVQKVYSPEFSVEQLKQAVYIFIIQTEKGVFGTKFNKI